MQTIRLQELYDWCSVPVSDLVDHPKLRIPFRLCKTSADLGEIMARELCDVVRRNNERGEPTRAIIPCGPGSYYKPFTTMVNKERLSLKRLVVFHMDECLDWEGHELPRQHPYSFRGTMEKEFYGPVDPSLAVKEENRCWLTPRTMVEVEERIREAPIDITLGGWGQDGHVAYNQARRQTYDPLSLEELRNSSIRIQENNTDTILALAHRTFGAAYQFVPPMSVTLGMKECLSAKSVRLFSDTGAWKQTALRVALFSPMTTEYPITLLQDHPDAMLTADVATAEHPIGNHPEWVFWDEPANGGAGRKIHNLTSEGIS
jgi:glucosamine-6-phosphate deaminase